MADTKKDTVETTSTVARDDPSTQLTVGLLANILREVQADIQGTKPKQLQGRALQAVDQFRDIVAALALAPKPTIALDAYPTTIPGDHGDTTLTWSSTGAHRVSIRAQSATVDRDLGVTTLSGSIVVTISEPTMFTATADPCGGGSITVKVDTSS